MAYKKLTLVQHYERSEPKRILALDGGGLRGIVTLGYLKRVEDILRKRHGADETFRLSDYFDLIGGTSTGAIIAAALALGMSVDEIIDLYIKLGKEVFWRSRWRKGILRARYSHEKLTVHLKRIFGKDTTLGDAALKTGLLVMTKRVDTGSPWPLGNNPKGRYFQAKPTDDWVSNKDYPLWKVVRASTAAPSYFDPEKITIVSRKPGMKAVEGEFVDGGVSPFNNPTLQAFMYATLQGFGVKWKAGADKLFILSVGTGRGDPSKEPTWIAAKGAVQSLLSLMDDSGALVETMAQWMSVGPTHRKIDREVGDLLRDSIGPEPSFTYVRYDLSLREDVVKGLNSKVSTETLETLTQMDEPDNMPILKELADLDAEARVTKDHFPVGFDLR